MQEGSSQSKFAQSLAPDLSSSRAGGIFILLSLWKSTGFLAWVSSADSRSGGRNALQVPVFVRCIDFIKPLLPVLVLDIWGNTIYRASVSTFMACEELLGGFQLQSHWCLRAFLWPPPFPLIILVCGWLVVFALLYCASTDNSQNVSESLFNLFTAPCATRWWWQVNGLCLNEITVFQVWRLMLVVFVSIT